MEHLIANVNYKLLIIHARHAFGMVCNVKINSENAQPDHVAPNSIFQIVNNFIVNAINAQIIVGIILIYLNAKILQETVLDKNAVHTKQ